MYPQPTDLSPSTSNAAPKPTSIFQPSSTDKSTESSPQSSLPCGQRTPAASTSSSDTPFLHTPAQPFVHSQHQTKIPTPTQHTSPKPHKQQIQQTPVKTNANQPTQPSISDEDHHRVPKTTNSSQVKCSKQQLRQQDECLCFHCNLPGHLKRSCPEIPYCSKCRTRRHAQDRCTNNSQRNKHTRQAGESRDQQKRNEDLPQFSSRHSRKIHEVNHVNIGHEDEVEINEAHVRNPNYKGKNYNPNYAQNRSKTTNTTNNTSNHQNNTTQSYGSASHHNNSNPGHGYNKSNQQEKLVNVSVTLHGPVSKEQLYKIQEVLRHPSQYRDRIKPEDRPVKGEYANAFNKFHPKKVEVNEATVEEAIKYGQFLKRSKEDITEAIDIYKTLGNETFYSPEEDPVDQQEQPKQ